MEVLKRCVALGAEVVGLDLSNGAEAELPGLLDAWSKNPVLLFRRQKLNDGQLVKFSRNFGDLDKAPPSETSLNPMHPYMSEVTIISNVVVDGEPIGSLGAGEAEWHTDMSYCPAPPSASLLYSLEIPSIGGDTSFCNMYSAYETLPAELKRAISGRSAIHDATYTSAGHVRKGTTPVDDVTKTPGARHPIVRIHPLTRRPSLFLGRRRNSYIVGLPVNESEDVLDRLWEHATQSQFCYTHSWNIGDVLMWDNRCVMHRRDGFDPNSRRVMHRTQVKGEVPVLAELSVAH